MPDSTTLEALKSRFKKLSQQQQVSVLNYLKRKEGVANGKHRYTK